MGKRIRKAWKSGMVELQCPDPPTVTLENLDVLEWEERIETANIDSFFLSCKDHWGTCLYETRIGHMHRGLTFDFIGEMSQSLRTSKIEFVAHYSMGLDTYAVANHPEWGMRDARGHLVRVEDAGVEKWHRCCTMTGYMDHVLAQLEEILENYRPDGLYLDAFLHPLCYCDDCQRSFREKYGFPIPRRRQDIKKHLRQCDDFMTHVVDLKAIMDVKSLLKRIHPDCWLSLCDSWKINAHLRSLLDYHFASPGSLFWEEVLYAQSVAGEQGLQIFVGGLSNAYDFSFEKTKTHKVAKVTSRGLSAVISNQSMGPDGSLDRTEFERMGKIFHEMACCQKILGKTRPVPCAAVLAEERSRSALSDMDMSERVLDALTFLGRLQIPVDVIRGEEMTPMKLSPYQIIVIPNIHYITADMAKALLSFVKRGGAILATEETGLYGKDGLCRNEFVLSDIFGCEYCGSNSEYQENCYGSYLELDVHDIWGGLSLFHEPPTPGVYIRLRLTTGSAAATHILPSTPLTSSSWVGWGPPPPAILTEDPAVVINNLGKGRCIYVGFNLFDPRLPWTQFVADCFVDWLVPKLSIRVKTPCPSVLRSTFVKRKKKLLIHLVNDLGEKLGRDTMSIAGSSIVAQKAYWKISNAKQVYPTESRLNLRQTKEAVLISIPRIDSHMILELSVR